MVKRTTADTATVVGGRVVVETTVSTPINFYANAQRVPFVPMDATVWPHVRTAWPDIKPGDRIRVTVERLP
jgi:hypothetical protein